MSVAVDRRRRHVLYGLSAAAGVSLLAGLASRLPPARPARRVEQGELVFPQFAANSEAFSLAMVTTTEEAYHLTRDPGGWVMPEKDLHPVRPERIRALAQALASLRFERPMTRDERKFDRLGLGDPATGGAGALIEAGDGSGGVFAKALLGHRDGRSYVRFVDDLQAWAVTGEPMPPLHRAILWLETSLVDLDADPVLRVEVLAGSAASYRLVVEEGATRFEEGRAPVSPLAQLALSETALALGRWAPVDVARRSPDSSAVLVGRHRAVLASGLGVELAIWREGTAHWAQVAATADAPGSRPQAEALNARMRGWIYRLRDIDATALLPPRSRLEGFETDR
jgi:hypothetical protein